MRVIVPGGYYSYDSAGKKIWLDYQYYGTTLENIERVKNLTRNKILYDCKRPTVLPTVANGCITHSYQGTEADTDKIQITLRTPITDSLTELTPVDGVVTLETDGKVLVLPTSNAAILPSFNQSVLDPNRLTIAESPFGGLKGAGSPDYCPGTLYTATDGVYLTDTSGNNSTKTLTAGKLKELGLLSVDTAAHTITEEFIIRNDNLGSDVQVIDACDSASGWTIVNGTGTITIENGRLKCVGTTDASGKLRIKKTFSIPDVEFITIDVESVNSASFMFYAFFSGGYKAWYKDSLTNSFNNKVVFPIKCITAGSTGRIPNEISGTPTGNPTYVYVGLSAPASTQHTFYLDNITACNGTWAKVEVAVPDNLKASKTAVTLFSHNGVSYENAAGIVIPNDGSTAVDNPSFNDLVKFLDSTSLDSITSDPSPKLNHTGLEAYRLGSRGSTKTDCTYKGSRILTYSSNYGTQKRIGFAILMPPSDNGRTGINQCRLKLVTYYDKGIDGYYSSTYEFSNDTNTSTGLQNVISPWIAVLDPDSHLIDFYLFTHRPQNLSFKRDETGTIYSLSLYPGAGSVYHGQIPFADLTLDTNSDTIPDCLEAAVNGSVTKFLANYSMVI